MNDSRWQTESERWQPPWELQRSIPRPVRLSGGGIAAVAGMAALAIGAVVLTAVLYGISERDTVARAKIESEGVWTDAEVVSIGPARGKDGRRSVAYRYSAGGGEYTGRVSFQRRAASGLEIGSRIRVRYPASDPATSYVDGREPKGVPVFVFPLLLLGFALPVVLIGYKIRRQRRLLSEGRAALARVTSAERFRRGEHKGYRVKYEFHTLSGAARAGSYEVSRKPPEAGSTFTVLYHPDEPRLQGRYPISLVRTDYS